MSEQAIKDEVQRWTTETLVALLFAAQHAATADPAASLEKLRQQLLERARNQTFKGLDPALSDHVAGELEASIEHAISLQRQWLG